MMSHARAARNATTSFVYGFALTVALAYGVSAQTLAPPELHIRIDGDLCNDVNEVWVAINGSDAPANADRQSKCIWILKEIGNQSPVSYFSLRLRGVGRTRCRKAKPIKGSNNIQLIFKRIGERKAHDLKIAGPHVDYTRELTAAVDDDVPCLEGEAVPRTLFDVQFDIEHLRLGLFEKKTVACGVIVDDVPALSKPRIGVGVPITYKELAPLILTQGIKAENCYAPTVLPPEAIEHHLRGQTPLTITVK